MSNLTPAYSALVKALGGQVSTAKALKISQPTVSGYINGRWNMSEIVALRAEIATKGSFKAVDLCPALKDLNATTAA